MKKSFILIFLLIFTTTSIFAGRGRFYENGKVIDTMYVASKKGLRVHSNPSTSAQRICSLDYRFPVKIVAVGKSSTIDGISDPWIEILLPRYEWKNSRPEYGWVFGGYLSKTPIPFTEPEDGNDLASYLENNYWEFWWEAGGDCHFEKGLFQSGNLIFLNKDNYHVNFYDEAVDFYQIINSKTISFENKYSIKFGYNSYSINLLPKGYVKFYISPDFFNSIDKEKLHPKDNLFDFYGNLIFPEELGRFLFKDKRGFALYQDTKTLINYYEENNFSDYSIIEYAIESGISAKGTKYETEYQNYWIPIMKEHQKKADIPWKN